MNRMIRFGRIGVCVGQPISFNTKVYGKPKNSSVPTISGTPAVGQILTRGAGVWTNAKTVTWQWLSNGVAVASNTATYTVAAGDAGHTITLRETAVTGNQSATATSAGVAIP